MPKHVYSAPLVASKIFSFSMTTEAAAVPSHSKICPHLGDDTILVTVSFNMRRKLKGSIRFPGEK